MTRKAYKKLRGNGGCVLGAAVVVAMFVLWALDIPAFGRTQRRPSPPNPAAPIPTGKVDLAQYDDKVDAAVDKALAYLASQQQADGSFACPMPGNTAITSLSVMAFLAKGYTPGTGPYGKVLDRAIDHVLKCQKPNGLLVAERGQSHGPMYCHGTSTLMLSEVSGMVAPERQKKIDAALAKALNVILTAQKIAKPGHHQGGWRYHLNSNDSDISCTGWQLMALRSARNNVASVPKEAIDGAVKYVMGLRCGDGGFGYSDPAGPGLARTGTALLCLELCGKHGAPVTAQAGDWILRNMPTALGDGHFYYGIYYVSQGMFQLGGNHWQQWASWLYQNMLKFQKPDGSWPAEAGPGGPGGPCYSTAMSVLAMSVSYRQLPIYQR